MNKHLQLIKEKAKSKQKRQMVDKNKVFTLFDLIFVSCFVIITTLALVFSSPIEIFINKSNNEQVSKITISQGVKAHILNVGQAGCTIVELPNNKILVYDTGLKESFNHIKNYLTKEIETSVIDYLILSHTDSDHIGGAEDVLNLFEVKNIIRPVVKSAHPNFNETNNISNLEDFSVVQDELYANVLNKVYTENAEVFIADYNNIETLNQSFDGDDYNIELYIPTFYKSSNSNDFSIVVTITHQGKTLMLTGDATHKSEKNLLENYALPDVDFMVLAHHGSSNSSSFEFLQKVKPEYVYISAGKNNSYNHPHEETLNKLKLLGVEEEKLYVTYNCGDIVLAYNGQVVQHYLNNHSIKVWYIVVGLYLVVLFSYYPKIKKYIVYTYVKIRRNKKKTNSNI